MMMNLVNSRMGYGFTNDTVSTELSADHRRPVFSTLHGGISVTREECQWTDEEPSSHRQEAKRLKSPGELTLDSGTNV